MMRSTVVLLAIFVVSRVGPAWRLEAVRVFDAEEA